MADSDVTRGGYATFISGDTVIVREPDDRGRDLGGDPARANLVWQMHGDEIRAGTQYFDNPTTNDAGWC